VQRGSLIGKLQNCWHKHGLNLGSIKSKRTHYQSPYKVRARKIFSYNREKGSNDLLEMGDKVMKEEIRDNYPQLLCNRLPKVQVSDTTKYPAKDSKSCLVCLSQVLKVQPL